MSSTVCPSAIGSLVAIVELKYSTISFSSAPSSTRKRGEIFSVSPHSSDGAQYEERLLERTGEADIADFGVVWEVSDRDEID